MGYIKDLDPWFAEVLKHVPVDQLEPIELAIKKKILESFKNGIVVSRRMLPRTPDRSAASVRSIRSNVRCFVMAST